MAILSKEARAKTVINLSGPEGNVFALKGFAKKLGRNILGYSDEEISDVLTQMESSDYENAIAVFDEHFGDLVDLQR